MGLDNHGFRYYDPEVGRYISRDPLAGIEGPNPYLYVGNNPVNRVDPDGQLWGAVLTAGFAVWDTVQYARGKIDGAEYTKRMVINGAALVAEAATGGMGGGVAVRAAAITARAGKVGTAAIRTAQAIDKADQVVSTVEAGVAVVQNAEAGNLRGVAVAAVSTALGAKGSTSGGGKVTNAADNANKHLDEVQDVQRQSQAAMDSSGRAIEGGCFVAGTVVATGSGPKPIETLQVGDTVWAVQPGEGESTPTLRTVTETFVRHVNTLTVVVVNGEAIQTTPDHPFWIPEEGWVPAGKLVAGDTLLTLQGVTLTVERTVTLSGPVTVYNFTVDGLHDYFVGAQKVLVHNNPCSQPAAIQYPLKKPVGVSDTEWQAKLDAMNAQAAQGKAKIVHDVSRPPEAAQAQRQAREQGMIREGDQADHALDMQFGGSAGMENIRSTPARINQSVGAQGKARQQYPDGTPIERFVEKKE